MSDAWLPGWWGLAEPAWAPWWVGLHTDAHTLSPRSTHPPSTHPPPSLPVLCREEAVKVWGDRAKFEAAGVRLVCLVHEWIDRSVGWSVGWLVGWLVRERGGWDAGGLHSARAAGHASNAYPPS